MSYESERAQRGGKLDDRYRCGLCVEQGWPDHFGSMPRCAFSEDGSFLFDNWCCALLSKLRGMVELTSCGESNEAAWLWCNDQSLLTFALRNDEWKGDPMLRGDFLVLSHYKERGRVEGLWVVDSGSIRKATESDCRAVLKDRKERNL